MPQPSHSQSADISLRVRASRLQLLCRQSKGSAPFYLVAMGLLCFLVRASVPSGLMLLWIILVGTTILLRNALLRTFKRPGSQGPAILAWERPFLLVLLMEALLWGIGCAAFMNFDYPTHTIVLMVFLLGIAGGTYPLYASQRSLLLATQTALLLPATCRLLLAGDPTSLGLAAAATLFGLSALRSSRILTSTLCESFRLSFELQEAKEAAEQLARRDPLTDLPNRRALEEDAHLVASTCARLGHPLTVITFDLDHFKHINDTLGHAAGDAALRQVAHLLRSQLRSSDVFGRVGGEEFGILVSAHPEEGCALAEKLRKAIERSPASFEEATIPLTASFGVATGQESFERLFQQADEALYQAKREGRNCVVCHHCPAGRDSHGLSPRFCGRDSAREAIAPDPFVPA